MNTEENSLKQFIQNLAYRSFYNFKSYKVFSPIFTKSDINLLKNLANDKSIIICKPDKGQGVVIMNKTDYINPLAFLGCAGPGSWANKVNEVTKK